MSERLHYFFTVKILKKNYKICNVADDVHESIFMNQFSPNYSKNKGKYFSAHKQSRYFTCNTIVVKVETI